MPFSQPAYMALGDWKGVAKTDKRGHNSCLVHRWHMIGWYYLDTDYSITFPLRGDLDEEKSLKWISPQAYTWLCISYK